VIKKPSSPMSKTCSFLKDSKQFPAHLANRQIHFTKQVKEVNQLLQHSTDLIPASTHQCAKPRCLSFSRL